MRQFDGVARPIVGQWAAVVFNAHKDISMSEQRNIMDQGFEESANA